MIKITATARAGNVVGGGDWSPHRSDSRCVQNLEKPNTIEITESLSYQAMATRS